jgi:hypothetical protein
MSMLRRMLPLAWVVLAAIYSCGTFDGGSRGTGITSTVHGNVVAVQNPGGASDQLQGIRVTVQGRGAQTVTDSTGLFSAQGRFEGQITLLFTRRADRIRARIATDVPAGGTLTLNGIRVDTSSHTAVADSVEVDFLGEITQIDCMGQTLLMVPAQHSAKDTDTYTLMLGSSSLLDSRGNPVSCSELQTGQIGHVQATVNPDGSFDQAQVVLE